MTRLFSLCLILIVAACTTARIPHQTVSIGEDVSLDLPLPPGFPGTFEERTRLRISANGEGATVNVYAMFNRAAGLVRVTHPTGPTLLDVEWSGDGISERRNTQLPDEIRSEELLAALYILLWPGERVAASLSPGATFVEQGPVRAVQTFDRTVMVLRQIGNRVVVDHYDYGYRFEIAGFTP